MKSDLKAAALDSIVGGILGTLRKSRGMTQEAVSKQVGLERTSIVNIELGRQGLSLYTFIKYCRAIKVRRL